MKEIEVIVKKFEANDGTRFDDKESCDKYEEECKERASSCANRIAMIKAKKIKIDEENAEYARKQELKLNELRDKILSMGNRIKEIISVGEELYNNEFNITDWNCRVGNVGFEYRNYSDHQIEIALGIRKAEPLGNINMETDGEVIGFSYKINDSDKIYMLERFLEDFDRFETKFYEWVDKYFN